MSRFEGEVKGAESLVFACVCVVLCVFEVGGGFCENGGKSVITE